MEIFFLTEAKHHARIYSISKSLELWGYDYSRMGLLYVITIAMGFIFRFIGLFSLYCLKPTSYLRIVYDWIKAKFKVFQHKKQISATTKETCKDTDPLL